MTAQPQGNDKARIIPANLLLQAKVGIGVIEDDKIQKMQKIMDETRVDFAPMAGQFLAELDAAIANARNCDGSNKEEEAALIARMTPPVMQIKANAAMFNYPLVGRLANIVLNFLENATRIDKTMLDIIDAHRQTLSVIVKNKMTGTGGPYGLTIETELKGACQRYFKKRGIEATFSE